MGRRLAAKITGVAGYVPPRLITNADLERMVDTTDEWIQQRAGIRERHIVDRGMATSHLATAAAQQLLEKTGSKPAVHHTRPNTNIFSLHKQKTKKCVPTDMSMFLGIQCYFLHFHLLRHSTLPLVTTLLCTQRYNFRTEKFYDG